MGRRTPIILHKSKRGGWKGPVPGSVRIRAAVLARTRAPLPLQRLAPQHVLSLARTCPWHPRLYLSPKAVLPSTRFCGCPPLRSRAHLCRLLLPVPGPPVSKVSGLK